MIIRSCVSFDSYCLWQLYICAVSACLVIAAALLSHCVVVVCTCFGKLVLMMKTTLMVDIVTNVVFAYRMISNIYIS